MKTFFYLLLLGVFCINSAMAVCADLPLTKFEQKRGYVHQICGNVTQIQDAPDSYAVTNIEEVVGDAMASQMYFFQSKNRICRVLLSEAGVSGETRYVRRSMQTWGRAMRNKDLPTISSVRCEVKRSKKP